MKIISREDFNELPKRLKVEERDELFRQTHQALLGVPGTDEKGMAGDIKEIKTRLKILNGQVSLNTLYRKIGTGVSVIVLTALIGLLVKLFNGG